MQHTANDFLRALRGEPCSRVPYQEPCVSALHVEAVLGRPLGRDSTRLAPADDVEFTLATGQSALYHNALWKAGRLYRAASDGERQCIGGIVRTREDFARLEPFDIEGAVRRVRALADAASQADLALVVSFPSPFRLAMYAMGYEAFLTCLRDEPQFVLDLIAWFHEPARQYLERLLECPVEAFLLAGTICTGSGPVMSPAMLRRFWLEDTRRFLEPVTQRRLPVILHLDGDFSSIVDLIAELPIAAIHPFERTGALDIYDFKSRFGDRIAVWGNIDLSSVLTRGTPDQVREDVRRHIERLAPGGRYVLGSSHEITPDVPVANFRALVKAAQDFGAKTACASPQEPHGLVIRPHLSVQPEPTAALDRREASRARVLAALEHRRPDRVPRTDFFWPDYAQRVRARHNMASDARIEEYFGMDVGLYAADEAPFPSEARVLRQSEPETIARDGWGRTIRTTPGSFFSEVIAVPVARPADLDRLRFEPACMDSRYERSLSNFPYVPERFPYFVKTGGPYIRSTFLRGAEALLTDLAADWGFARALADRIAEHLIAVTLESLRRTGHKDIGVFIADDMASLSGPMFSPACFEEVYAPAYQRMIHAFRQAGVPRVLLHCDGNAEPLLDVLVGLGISAHHPCEPRAGMDVERIMKRFGRRLTIMGGMCNCVVLPQGPISKIVEETRRLIALGREGGLIIASHSIGSDIPLEHYEAYIRTLDEEA